MLWLFIHSPFLWCGKSTSWAVFSMNLRGAFVIRVNILQPRNAHMYHFTGSSLVKLMAWCLTGTKPLPEPILIYHQFDTSNKPQWNFILTSKFFIEENAFENVVCKMLAMLFRPHWVKLLTEQTLWRRLGEKTADAPRPAWSDYGLRWLTNTPLWCVTITPETLAGRTKNI